MSNSIENKVNDEEIKLPDIVFSDYEHQDLSSYSKKAYLEYAMYVIKDRAIPFIGDGLKPVHRRILYSMFELKLDHTGGFKKSARTVGDVLGKYHPHGDSACYEAMVNMAQPFSSRYPLIEGQGNWGSSDDPSSFAAMRYTESKLDRYSTLLLKEVDKDIVPWTDNFDGSLQEPKSLPARLPNILLNGGIGIAVGLSSDILPHNVSEVGEACLRLIDNPEATTDELLEHIKGPDFPTGGKIVADKESLKEIYETGNGVLTLRGRYKIEDNGNIVFYEIPYKTSGSDIIKMIADQITKQITGKKVLFVEDVRDESDHKNPIRIVVVPKNKMDVNDIINHLYATTKLEEKVKINMNAINLNGLPKLYNLKELLSDWLIFRRTCIINRTKSLLKKTEYRVHILEAYEKAFEHMDDIIHIIRTDNNAFNKLMSQYGMSEIQARHILEMKLKSLAKLEEEKVKIEKEKLVSRIEYCNTIINHPRVLNEVMREEIIEAVNEFSDKRKTDISYNFVQSKEIEENLLAPTEKITVVLSDRGWIKAGKGDLEGKSLSYKSGDTFLDSSFGLSNNIIVFFDNKGKIYNLPYNSIPSARGHGEPISSKLNILNGAKITNVLIMEKDKDYLVTVNNGYGYYAKGQDFETKAKAGKKMMSLRDDEWLIKPVEVNLSTLKYVVIASSSSKIISFGSDELVYREKGGKGVQLIKLGKDEEVKNILLINDFKKDKIFVNKKILSEKDVESIFSKRAKSGKKTFGDIKKFYKEEIIDEE